MYLGNLKLTDKTEVEGVNAGQLFLSPARTYAPIIKEILEDYRAEIHGMIYCSGGAQTKVLNFVENLHIKKDNLFPVPPLFRMIQEQSGMPWREMYQVFNMGHRMELYVNEDIATDIISISENYGITARIIGRYEAAENKKLSIFDNKNTYLF